MSKNTSERAFQTFIKDKIKSEGGWVSQLHPGLGSDIGIPDLLTAVDVVGILPIELKIGTLEDERTVWSRAVRPSQISWHQNLTGHGYLSCILVGVPNGKSWRIFVVDGLGANKAKDGYIMGEDIEELDTRYLLDSLNSWAERTNYSFED